MISLQNHTNQIYESQNPQNIKKNHNRIYVHQNTNPFTSFKARNIYKRMHTQPSKNKCYQSTLKTKFKNNANNNVPVNHHHHCLLQCCQKQNTKNVLLKSQQNPSDRNGIQKNHQSSGQQSSQMFPSQINFKDKRYLTSKNQLTPKEINYSKYTDISTQLKTSRSRKSHKSLGFLPFLKQDIEPNNGYSSQQNGSISSIKYLQTSKQTNFKNSLQEYFPKNRNEVNKHKLENRYVYQSQYGSSIDSYSQNLNHLKFASFLSDTE